MSVKLIRRLFILFLPVVLLILCSVYPSINSEDKKYIQAFVSDWKLPVNVDSVHNSFENEVAFITKVQDSVIYTIHQEEIPHKFFGSVSYYYNNRKGFCYDRAVLMEKIFSYYHFSFRHAYIYFGNDSTKVGVDDFFKRRLASHGVVEVKTKKGWMTVETIANWIGLDKDNQVLDLSKLRNELSGGTFSFTRNITAGNCFWIEHGIHFKFIYGLYSRHGDFFDHSNTTVLGLPHFLPDYNLKMLFYNF
jgi:hypothetical protein